MTNNILQCRICTKINSEEAQNIFEQPEGKLLRHIEQLTGIMLMDSKYLPQHICLECLRNLRQARAFRRRCIKSQIYFTTPAYKSTTRRDVEKNQKQNVNIKAEQCNFVGTTTTTTMDNQYNNESEEVAESKYSLDEENSIIFENEENSSHENSIILDVKSECEARTSNAASTSNFTRSSNHSKFTKDKIANYKPAIQNVCKRRTITEYMCEQCGKIYENLNYFRTHLNRHAGIKPFQCKYCPSKFYTKTEVKLHTTTHTGERPFECKYCDRCYATSGARLVHERLHTNERPYKCKYCPKSFTTLDKLKRHVMAHTKERKFECSICYKYFQRRTQLVAHNRSQLHKENVEKLENSSEVIYEELVIEPLGQMQ